MQPKTLAHLNHEHFRVIVFVGASQAKVPFEIATAMQCMGTKAEYVKICGHGSNALDFHIAFYIGQIAAADPDAFFHIISKDTGFDPLLQHLKTKKIFAARREAITEIPLASPTTKETLEIVLAKFQNAKFCKPGTVDSLANSIRSMLQNRCAKPEIAELIAALVAKHILKITGNKVTYPAAVNNAS
ncbi:MAG: hypothetical protein JWL90_1813 [Chthoniobacteraceae bacterium]|nr:hypothetical protein [Chthoniobacteraceae bacterium]